MFPAWAAKKWVSDRSFQERFQHCNCSHCHYRTKISVLLMLIFFWWGMCYKAIDNHLLVSPDVSDKGNMSQHMWINMCLKERNGWVYSNNTHPALSEQEEAQHFEKQSIIPQALLLSWHENILLGCVQISVGFLLKFTHHSFQPKKWINLTVFTKLFAGRGWKNCWYSLALTIGFPKKKHNCWNT